MADKGSRQERQPRQHSEPGSSAEKPRPPKVLVPQANIVPGGLTEAEVAKLRAREEGEEVVGDIMEELVERVMDAAYKSYLERQCIPYTVDWARETMLQMVQLRFMPRDKGEPNLAEDPTWAEDEEPTPCPIDTWARGAVPVRCAPSLVARKKSQGRGLDPKDQESQDLQKGPHPVPGVLKAMSQVVRKPTLLPKVLKMAPGASTWNPATQELLSHAEPQQEDKEGSTSRPIHTGAPEPQVTVAQPTKNSGPQISSLPSKHLPHPGP
ncbi:uncharacterized protein C2orf81 homolog [Camelus bactrianus]|uniref:Uncharacterized protein C2orf81 homolog n=1 Tax=Camelus bactrianus TaxID=9837 RepID=A0AC58P1C7_CAMBA